MDDVRTPTQFLDCFQYTACIENSACIVVFIFNAVLINHLQAVLKVIVVVDKVNLHAGRLYGSYFNDKRMVGIVNDKVHAGETYHFVQLVSALVDVSPFGHKRSDFSAFFLDCLRQVSANKGHFGF